jgi:hypothetical protein
MVTEPRPLGEKSMAIVTWTRSRARLAALLVLAASAGVLGCGTKTGTVSGKVSYGNKTVTSGEVLFLTQDGKSGAHAAVQPDGTYQAINVPLGTLKVGLQNPPPLYYQQIKNRPRGVADDPEMQEAAKRAAHYVPTPPKYQDPNQSGLTTNVKPGENTYNLELR